MFEVYDYTICTISKEVENEKRFFNHAFDIGVSIEKPRVNYLREKSMSTSDIRDVKYSLL